MRIVAALIAAALLGSAPIGSAWAQSQATGLLVALQTLEPLKSTGAGQRFPSATSASSTGASADGTFRASLTRMRRAPHSIGSVHG